MRRMNKKFNELFILRTNNFFRFEVERIVFRDIQLETIPMKLVLHETFSQMLIGNISTFLGALLTWFIFPRNLSDFSEIS